MVGRETVQCAPFSYALGMSPRRGTRDAQRQLDRLRHLVFRLTWHDAEVTAFDGEGGTFRR